MELDFFFTERNFIRVTISMILRQIEEVENQETIDAQCLQDIEPGWCGQKILVVNDGTYGHGAFRCWTP
jgi:hypothetical protein